jgi:ribosomal protein L24E
MILREDNDIKELFEVLGDRTTLVRSHLVSARDLRKLVSRIQGFHGIFSLKTLIITETLKESPHRVPKGSVDLHLTCEFCGKEIVREEEFHTVQLDNIPHYFCCSICKRSYAKWREEQLARRLKPKFE